MGALHQNSMRLETWKPLVSTLIAREIVVHCLVLVCNQEPDGFSDTILARR